MIGITKQLYLGALSSNWRGEGYLLIPPLEPRIIPSHQFNFQSKIQIQQMHRIVNMIIKCLKEKQVCTAAFLTLNASIVCGTQNSYINWSTISPHLINFLLNPTWMSVLSKLSLTLIFLPAIKPTWHTNPNSCEEIKRRTCLIQQGLHILKWHSQQSTQSTQSLKRTEEAVALWPDLIFFYFLHH